MWEGSPSLGEDGYIFVHLLGEGYCTPGEINFPGGGAYIQNDPSLPTYPTNYVDMAQKFVSDARSRNKWYTHENILIPFGCDFQHTNAYKSMIQMVRIFVFWSKWCQHMNRRTN